MEFPLEKLTEYQIIEFLERLDDETLYTMCAHPISKKIFKICKMNGDIRKRTYRASLKMKIKEFIESVPSDESFKVGFEIRPSDIDKKFNTAWVKGQISLHDDTMEYLVYDATGAGTIELEEKISLDDALEFFTQKYLEGFELYDVECNNIFTGKVALACR